MPHSPTFDIELGVLLEAVYQRYQHDFRHYARASLARRLRQAMEDFGCRTLSHLQERLLHEPEVFARLLGYFTVQVSEMYRDPAYFRALRGRMVFADHSLATDSVFSEVHLVSCRNVLIYFDRELQERALKLFDEALIHRGFLGLGSRETLRFTSQASRYAEFCASERIYQRL